MDNEDNFVFMGDKISGDWRDKFSNIATLCSRVYYVAMLVEQCRGLLHYYDHYYVLKFVYKLHKVITKSSIVTINTHQGLRIMRDG